MLPVMNRSTATLHNIRGVVTAAGMVAARVERVVAQVNNGVQVPGGLRELPKQHAAVHETLNGVAICVTTASCAWGGRSSHNSLLQNSRRFFSFYSPGSSAAPHEFRRDTWQMWALGSDHAHPS